MIKEELGLYDKTYRSMYPMGACSPKFYRLPKYIKETLRPIVLSGVSVRHGVTKVIAGILKPLVSRSQHHILNAQHYGPPN